MIATLLVTGALLALLLAAVWPVLGDLRKREEDSPAPAATVSVSLEGSLVSGLIRHDVTPAQYRRAMEHMARRDDDLFPLRVPPAAGSRDQGPW
jgi:hypothetical protein